LRDISDYSSFIEQKISKLNHIYRSLNANSNKDNGYFRLSRARILTKGQGEGRTLFRTAQHPFHARHHSSRPHE
jgi:hypothetical protein